MCANSKLLNATLRIAWGFEGYVTSAFEFDSPGVFEQKHVEFSPDFCIFDGISRK